MHYVLFGCFYRWVCDGSTTLGCLDGSDEEDFCGACASGYTRCDDRVLCKVARCPIQFQYNLATLFFSQANTTNLVCGGECATFGFNMCEAEGSCVSHRQTCNGTCLG